MESNVTQDNPENVGQIQQQLSQLEIQLKQTVEAFKAAGLSKLDYYDQQIVEAKTDAKRHYFEKKRAKLIKRLHTFRETTFGV